MPVFKGSRYEGQDYTSVTGKDQVTRKFIHFRESVKFSDIDPEWIQHPLQQGEELDSLAYKYSGNIPNKSKQYWLIADVNNVLFPLDVASGTKLVIPLKELQAQQPL